MKKIILVSLVSVVSVLLAGCLTSATKINAVSIGMSKEQVLKIMGQPSSVTTDTNAEYLNYNLAEVPTPFDMPGTPYEIKLVNGKVETYGRAGNPTSSRPVPVVVPMVH